MVNIKSYLLATSIWLLLSMTIGIVHAQSDILGKFSLDESDGQVALSWQIVAGSTCNGIQVYRSTDAVNFSRIGYIAGICGSLFEAVNYFFTDTAPVKNMVNYYYLELGGVGASQVIAIEIVDKGNKGYQIRPHPMQHEGTIYFDADDGNDYILKIYDPLGKEIFTAETSDDHFDINTSDYLPGQYVFSISVAGHAPRIQGKLIVQN